MADKKTRAPKPEHLIWAYLDGEISDEQSEALSTMLAERAGVREQFVESAVMHGMLREYYRARRDESASAEQAQHPDRRARPRRKRPSDRSSAA